MNITEARKLAQRLANNSNSVRYIIRVSGILYIAVDPCGNEVVETINPKSVRK